MRKDFERVTPESVGVPSKAIEWLLDQLEEITEPHGLMLMRHGKVFAEGWWAPYAPGIRHGLQSHSKTYAATAVGVAYTEGLIKLDERVIDIFPDEAPENPSENLKKLTVRDVLCMGCGMDTMPRPSVDWIRDFLAIPVNHVPGTTSMYNSTGSTLLGAMVRKKTGLGLHDYLKPRVFDKIGIDPDNLRWYCMADGMEMGGGGLFATTEDNLRLLKLYADGGVWDGERILAEDYVKLAVSLQNESATERAVNPPAEDNFVGYGFQIWMCRPKGVYRADGAMGQFSIVIPDRDMIIAITETAAGSTGGVGPQNVLDHMWEFLKMLPDPSVETLPEDEAASAHLAHRMKTLALAAPATSAPSALQAKVCGVKYAAAEGEMHLIDNSSARMMGGAAPTAPVEWLKLSFAENRCIIDFFESGKEQKLVVATDGSRFENDMDAMPGIFLCSGLWTDENTFEMTNRMVETCNQKTFKFKFDGDNLTVETPGFSFGRGPAVMTYTFKKA